MTICIYKYKNICKIFILSEMIVTQKNDTLLDNKITCKGIYLYIILYYYISNN